MDNDLQHIENELEEIKNYPVRLTWKQAWIALGTAVTILGSAFGMGMKIQYEAGKLIGIKKAQECEQKLAAKDDEIIELKRFLKEAKEDNIYYLNRYNTMKERLDKCMSGTLSITDEEANK